jgi:hypothetical protein
MGTGTGFFPGFVQAPLFFTSASSQAFAAPVTAGNLLIACVHNFTTDSQVTDTQGNTWTDICPGLSNGPTDYSGIWYTTAKKTGPNTCNFTGSGSQGWIMELSIVNTLDQLNSAGGVNVSVWSAGTIHCKRKQEFIIALVWAAATGIGSMPGWTLVGGSFASLNINYYFAGNGFDGVVTGSITTGNETAAVASFYATQTYPIKAKLMPRGV